MKVTISQHFDYLSKDKSFERFIYNSLCRLCQQQTAHSFIFLSSGKATCLCDNAISISLHVPFLMLPVKKQWLGFKAAAKIKKYNPDLVVSPDGHLFKTRAHQVLIMGNSADIKTIKTVVNYLRTNRPFSIITSSLFMKETLVKNGMPASAVFVLPPAPSAIFQPIDWDEAAPIKEKYTNGREYFLLPVICTPHQHIINVFKAFSQFKKWQQSNMKLVLLGKLVDSNPINKLLQSYKYRHDIIILEDPFHEADEVAITASAMTVIYLPVKNSSGLILASALQCGVPVITMATGELAETGGDAVLYCDARDIKTIAGNMMKLYKEEKLRYELICKGKERILPFSEPGADQSLWKFIEQMVAT